MLRTTLVPTLAVAAVAGSSAFITGSHAAKGTSLILPDCAGSGVVAAKTGLKPTSAQVPGASLEVVTAVVAAELATVLYTVDEESEQDDDVDTSIIDLEVTQGWIEVSVC